MAVDILGMDGNLYPPHFGALQGGFGPFNPGYNVVDPYARQTQMHLQRGPPLHARQSHGYYFAGHGRSQSAFKSHNPQAPAKRKFDTFAAPQAQQQPVLHQLRQDNARQARRHFQGPQGVSSSPGCTPRTAPRAPDNRHGFLLSAPGSSRKAQENQGALHAITPSAVPGSGEQLWKNSYGNADKEAVQLAAAAGLDFLGSFYDNACGGDDDLDLPGADSSPEVDISVQEAEAPPHTVDEEANYPPQAKRKLASQAAYIAQLEEQQLTLRERIFLLEQQLSEARRQQRGASPSGHSVDAYGGSDDDRATSSSG
ncbi:hypothetical protein Agub_g1501 [Astrephomene gubernaculifera]|uniref:Uncharacterized protein n=1 Tax=Astrephomene gubernaculifera TaxID=47775 RepID=A0AAD3HHK2_9CHLO|nr:hypothetical protein Agub_g1501 [Astrephomene gubernaculifera]